MPQTPAPNAGWIVTFRLAERPMDPAFDFDGMQSIQKAEILDMFKERAR